MWRERTKNLRDIKFEMVKAVQLDEKNAILARLDEVPSWVFFPDKERAEWVNKILKQSWPYFSRFMQTLIKDTIEPIIQASMPAVVGTIRFETVDLGDIVSLGFFYLFYVNFTKFSILKPPRIGRYQFYSKVFYKLNFFLIISVKVYTERVMENEIIIDLEVL